MKTKKLFLLFSMLLLISALFLGGCSDGKTKARKIILTDADGNAFYNSEEDTGQTENTAFIDIVLEELEAVIPDATGTINVKTSLDVTLQQNFAEVYKESRLKNVPFAAVITSTDGKILCAFSGGGEDENYAITHTQPYSAFKPLSVYSPAIEKGTINWASTFTDSPVKQTMNEYGEYEDWPVNGNGKYTNAETSIRDCIKLSLNTTAIRCLSETGVSYCMDFLSEKFGIDVSAERQQAALNGDEEVLHSIGLGYLQGGVSPVDMAGYYQIFATGGNYIKPYSVLEIGDSEGNIIYTAAPSAKALISESTAFIMNELLRSPLEIGGTAADAHIEGIRLGGKTGTGTDYAGNWFVCFSPEYCISVWHGKYIENYCTEIFSELSQHISFDSEKAYPECKTAEMKVYCKESGGGFTMNCPTMSNGYFATDAVPDRCTLHS